MVPVVLLTHLSSQMGVSAECFLMASHQWLVKRHYLLPLQTGDPSGFALDMVSLRVEEPTGTGKCYCHLGLGKGLGTVGVGEWTPQMGPCWEGDAPGRMLKRLDIGTYPSSKWYGAISMPQDSEELAFKVALQAERKLSWYLLSSSMDTSSRCWMSLVCDCWMEQAWEAPQVSASQMAVEQWAPASLIEWEQWAFASLMNSSVLDSFCQRVILKLETSFHLWTSVEGLVTSKSPKACWPPPGDGHHLREGHHCWALGFKL